MQSTEQCLASSKILTPAPHPLSTQRVCPPPAPKAVGGGGYTLAGERLGGGGHSIGLLQYNLSKALRIRIRIDLALLDPDPYWECGSKQSSILSHSCLLE
jgi:hypothetical protein